LIKIEGENISHYYTEKATNLEERQKTIDFKINNQQFNLKTNSGVFSKDGLDFGSRLLLEELLKLDAKSVLEVGCGYGAIVLPYAFFNPESKVIAVDINERAVNLAKLNARTLKLKNVEIKKSDLYQNIDSNFELIFSNPPIRAGKVVTYKIYEQAFTHLAVNGVLMIVIQKKQGAPSAAEKLKSIFGNVEVVNQKKGYVVLKSVKKT